MISVPNKYIDLIIDILEWHITEYKLEIDFQIMLKRILDKLYSAKTTEKECFLKSKEVYYVKECLSDAKNYYPYSNKLLCDIYDWIYIEYINTKR